MCAAASAVAAVCQSDIGPSYDPTSPQFATALAQVREHLSPMDMILDPAASLAQNMARSHILFHAGLCRFQECCAYLCKCVFPPSSLTLAVYHDPDGESGLPAALKAACADELACAGVCRRCGWVCVGK